MTKEQLFSPKYASELMKIAHGDLESAKALGQVPNTRVENVYYLGQQALEKALKAVLCAKGNPVPFVHDIGILVTKLEAKGIDAPFGYDLNSLSEYATIRRYIDGSEEYSKKEIEAVLAAVEQAVQWCAMQIKDR